jgi:cell division topological specificity factor
MTLFGLFKKPAPVVASAPIARDRLQVLLAHERGSTGRPDLIATLREEILGVISRHIDIDADNIKVTSRRGKNISTLKVDIDIPNLGDRAATKRAKNNSEVEAA